MDKGLFNNEELQQQHIHDLMGEFMRSGEIFIKDYKCKYGVWEDRKCISLTQQPDAWIIFEVATFGTLSKIYKNINISYRKRQELPMNSDLICIQNYQAGLKPSPI